MKIIKKCSEDKDKIYCERIRNNDPPYIMEIDKSFINTYRQIKPHYTFNSDAVYEQGISFKNENIFELLKDNENQFWMFEKLPSMMCFQHETYSKEINKYISESLILTDINILSSKVILIEKSETIGNIFFVTDNKHLYLNLKLRL